MHDFARLGLSDTTLRVLAQVKYEVPTPIQARAIPPALEGRDVIGCAATGTGKTAAFLLPLGERLKGRKALVALVLAPTRELALQISAEAKKLLSAHALRVATLIGGAPPEAQVSALKHAALCVGTPGRIVDHLDRGTLSLEHVEVLVLDEVDRMLDAGFAPELGRILKRVPRARQTLLFSATLDEAVEKFARGKLKDPVRVEVDPTGTTAERAAQVVYECEKAERTPLLLALLAASDERTLVFTRTRLRAEKLVKALTREGYAVERLHADRSQGQRRHALEGFRAGKFRVLVATDIAARGLDVAGIGHVVNYEVPHVASDYVHRVGRTARAAASGRASTLCAPEDRELLAAIEALLRAAVPRAPVPREDPVFRAAVEADLARQRDPGPQR